MIAVVVGIADYIYNYVYILIYLYKRIIKYINSEFKVLNGCVCRSIESQSYEVL